MIKLPCALRATARVFAVAAMLAATSCSSDSGWRGSGSGQVEELHLLGTPVAIDLDKKNGPDALGVRVYASSSKGVQAIRITEGTLSVLLFDGTVTAQQALSATPLVSFSYRPGDLRKFEYKTAVGISYNFLPAWGEHRPTRNRVTVVAVYTGAGNRTVRSTPVTVPMGKT